MLKKNERFVQFHYMDILRRPPHAPVIPIGDIYIQLKKLVDSNKAYKVYSESNELRILECAHYKENKPKSGLPESIVFLMRFTDTEVGNPAYSKLDKNEVEIKELGRREGVAVSAHIVICCVPVEAPTGTGFRHIFLLEEVPGLGRSNLQKILRYLFKEAIGRRLVWPDPAKPGPSKMYKPHVQIDQAINEQEDSCGVIKGFSLVKPGNVKTEIDEQGQVELETVDMNYRVISNPASIKDFFKWVTKFAKNKGHKTIKVRYKNKHGKQQSAIMGTNHADLHDMIVSKKERIHTSKNLPQCSEKIDDEVTNKMREFAAAYIDQSSDVSSS